MTRRSSQMCYNKEIFLNGAYPLRLYDVCSCNAYTISLRRAPFYYTSPISFSLWFKIPLFVSPKLSRMCGSVIVCRFSWYVLRQLSVKDIHPTLNSLGCLYRLFYNTSNVDQKWHDGCWRHSSSTTSTSNEGQISSCIENLLCACVCVWEDFQCWQACIREAMRGWIE